MRDLLKTQFPPTTRDVTDDEMFDVMDDVLRLQSTTNGKLPLTLVVLDEMQQYIGDDNDKALDVQNIVEGCSARFESQVLFVATGQSALTATPTLQKLIDRFPLPVELSDNDVETVVREVVLRKKPEHVPTLKSTLDAVSGEIDRQLGGTRYAPRGGGQTRPRARLPGAAEPVALLVRWLRGHRSRRQVRAAAIAARTRSTGRPHGVAEPTRSATSSAPTTSSSTSKAHVDMLHERRTAPARSTSFIQRMMSEGGDSATEGAASAP